MSWGTAAGVATLIAMIAFVGIVLWAWSSRRRARFDEAARLALDPEDRESDIREKERRR